MGPFAGGGDQAGHSQRGAVRPVGQAGEHAWAQVGTGGYGSCRAARATAHHCVQVFRIMNDFLRKVRFRVVVVEIVL